MAFVNIGCNVAHFFLVDAHTAAAYHFAGFSFGRKDVGLDGQEDQNVNGKLASGDIKRRNAIPEIIRRIFSGYISHPFFIFILLLT